MSNQFSNLAPEEVVTKTVEGLSSKGYGTFVVENKTEALEKIKNLIPAGASVMNGSSVTLEQIGFVDFLKIGTHGWKNLHATIIAEKDAAKQSLLRKEAALSDFYLGSVHALSQDGQFVIGSNTGSQLPHVVFTSQNLIFVVSTKKIVPDLATALDRLEQHIVPLEDKHMIEKYGSGTHLNKVLIFKGESQYSKRKITFILVKEDLGF